MTRQSVLATSPKASDWWCSGSGDEPARKSFFAGGRSPVAPRKPVGAQSGMVVAEQVNRAQASGQSIASGLRAFDLLSGNPPKSPQTRSQPMHRIFIVPLLASLSPGGCIQMDTLLEVYARSQQKGRPAEEAIAFFGTSQNMERTADGSQVVMQRYTDTSYLRYKMVNFDSEIQGNVMANTNYWDTVNHPSCYIISVTVDKSRQITQFEADGGELLLFHGCTGMKYGPPQVCTPRLALLQEA